MSLVEMQKSRTADVRPKVANPVFLASGCRCLSGLLQAPQHLKLISQSQGPSGCAFLAMSGFASKEQGASLVLFTLTLALELSPFQNALEGDRRRRDLFWRWAVPLIRTAFFQRPVPEAQEVLNTGNLEGGGGSPLSVLQSLNTAACEILGRLIAPGGEWSHDAA